MMSKMKAGGGVMSKMKAGGGVMKMGAVKTAAPSVDGVATKGKTRGKQITMPGYKMAGGGMAKKSKMMKSGGY